MLLPLVNVPMIDYTLELLTASDVSEVSLVLSLLSQTKRASLHQINLHA